MTQPSNENMSNTARDCGTLHLFGQMFEHADAYIIGNRRALELLREQIDKALQEGAVSCQGCNYFQNDGEGFPLHVALATEEELKGLSSAYHDPEISQDWDGTPPDEIVAARMRERDLDDGQAVTAKRVVVRHPAGADSRQVHDELPLLGWPDDDSPDRQRIEQGGELAEAVYPAVDAAKAKKSGACQGGGACESPCGGVSCACNI